MGKKKTYDCSGYATKYGTLCSDKRTIKAKSFKHQDGKTVPLVWNHHHNDMEAFVGHALLEERDDGVYAYCSFNDTERGQTAKTLVTHGDVTAFSIFANHLTEEPSKTISHGKDVSYGNIVEVSLVPAGANPGALIESLEIEHSDNMIIHAAEEFQDGVIIKMTDDDCNLQIVSHSDEESEHEEDNDNDDPSTEDQQGVEEKDLEHADKTKKENAKTIQDVLDGMSEEKKLVFSAVLATAGFDQDLTDGGDKDADVKDEGEDAKTIEDVLKTFTEEEMLVLWAYIGATAEQKDAKKQKKTDSENTKKSVAHTDMEENDIFMGNAFERNGAAAPNNRGGSFLSHSDLNEIVKTSIANQASLRKTAEAFVADKAANSEDETIKHSGITDIENLMPQYTEVNNGQPSVLNNVVDWVNIVINGPVHMPALKIKSKYIDITGDDARARGWVKSNVTDNSKKMDQTLLAVKRETTGQMIYVRQSFDRDDIIDADFDLLAFTKSEMKGKWQEELARAILVGDGRNANAKDKIKEDKIRPIAKDTEDDVYAIAKEIGSEGDTAADIAADLMDESVKALVEYRGKGNVTAFVAQTYVTEASLLKDGHGYRMYKNEADIAAAMHVSRVVAVPDNIMGNVVAILVDLRDYRLGSKASGNNNFFEDFDLDWNQMKYLLEGKVVGALVEPKSAIVFTKNF